MLGHASEKRDVAADVWLHVKAGNLGAEQQAAPIRRHTEVDQAEFLHRIDDDDVAAAAAQGHQRAASTAGWFDAGLPADEKEVEVFSTSSRGDGCGADAERTAEADAAGLVTVKGAVVDVVGAVQPGE